MFAEFNPQDETDQPITADTSADQAPAKPEEASMEASPVEEPASMEAEPSVQEAAPVEPSAEPVVTSEPEVSATPEMPTEEPSMEAPREPEVQAEEAPAEFVPEEPVGMEGAVPTEAPTPEVAPETPAAETPKVLTTAPEMPYATEVKSDISSNKLFAVLSYLSLLCLVVLALKSKSRFAGFHARQGLLIMIIQFLSLYAITMGATGLLIVGVTFGFSLVGILEVLRGNYWEFPFLGKLAQKLTFL